MSERLLTLLGALLALLLASGLLLHRPPAPTASGSRPLSDDRGAQGLAVAAAWLRGAGVPVLALRRRYDTLAADAPAPQGNLLITALPQIYDLRYPEVAALQNWLAAGNDLLLLADAHQRRLSHGSGNANSLLNTLGLSWIDSPAQPDDDCRASKQAEDVHAPPDTLILRPHPSDFDAPLLDGVRSLRVDLQPSLNDPGFVRQRSPHLAVSNGAHRLVTWWLCNSQRQQPVFWQFRYRQARLWITSEGRVFDNHNLPTADNAQLFANLVRESVHSGGGVIFDDMHQGRTALYDPAAFFADPRLHRSLWLGLAIWLIYLLGYSNRYVPLRRGNAAVTAVDFVDTVAGYLASVLRPQAAARALLQRYEYELRRRRPSLSSAIPAPPAAGAAPADAHAGLWALLAAQPQIDAQTIAALQRETQAIQRGRRKDLRPLLHLLTQLRKHGS